MFHVLSRGRQCEFSGHTNPCCWATAEQLLYPPCGCSMESMQKWMQLAQHTWSAVPKTTRSSPCSSKEAKSGIHLVNLKPAQNNPVTLWSHPQHLFTSQHLQSPRSDHAAEYSHSRNESSGVFMAMCPVHDSDAYKHMKYKKKMPKIFPHNLASCTFTLSSKRVIHRAARSFNSFFLFCLQEPLPDALIGTLRIQRALLWLW